MQDKRFCFCRVFQRVFFSSMVKNVIFLSARSSVSSAWHRLMPLCCSEFCISNPALILLCLRGFSCAHENNFCPHFSTTFLDKCRNSRQLHETKPNPTDQTHNPNLWFFFLNFFIFPPLFAFCWRFFFRSVVEDEDCKKEGGLVPFCGRICVTCTLWKEGTTCPANAVCAPPWNRCWIKISWRWARDRKFLLSPPFQRAEKQDAIPELKKEKFRSSQGEIWRQRGNVKLQEGIFRETLEKQQWKKSISRFLFIRFLPKKRF